jgi:hypothetical protein
VFVLANRFRPSLRFADKARAYPSEPILDTLLIVQAPGLTPKHLTMLEKFARDKHSSLLQKSVNYEQKIFYNIGPRLGKVSPFGLLFKGLGKFLGEK